MASIHLRITNRTDDEYDVTISGTLKITVNSGPRGDTDESRWIFEYGFLFVFTAAIAVAAVVRKQNVPLTSTFAAEAATVGVLGATLMTACLRNLGPDFRRMMAGLSTVVALAGVSYGVVAGVQGFYYLLPLWPFVLVLIYVFSVIGDGGERDTNLEKRWVKSIGHREWWRGLTLAVVIVTAALVTLAIFANTVIPAIVALGIATLSAIFPTVSFIKYRRRESPATGAAGPHAPPIVPANHPQPLG